ncbi:hypothetical protein GHK92_03020 [Nocardioides sp. dk4132]|uniref:hypothetical protein n=1 Tax=unclassified Nocardioides TaxID=2615069 RepID=UPI00129740B2|nr:MULTISPECIES: hypothetical protein [unclassified Nocardioides]MQW74833.1 hypothetical protein [Nocardioides sp. dk4132]QGA06721.1 hypothetical protein GFH29_04460 [Nocardioides sp. dk884]
MSEWTMHPSGETAVGAPVPVIGDGDIFATLSPIWSDEDGVRVSIDWARDIYAGITALEDLSSGQALALADALREAASTSPPERR